MKKVLFAVAVLVVLILDAMAVLPLGQKGYIAPGDKAIVFFVFVGAVLGYAFCLMKEERNMRDWKEVVNRIAEHLSWGLLEIVFCGWLLAVGLSIVGFVLYALIYGTPPLLPIILHAIGAFVNWLVSPTPEGLILLMP
jgi:hypothetical protein